MITLFGKAQDSFVRKHSALALGDENRRTRSRCWVRLMAIVLSLLSFSTGLQPANAGQKALLIGAGEYPYRPPEEQLSGPRTDVRLMKAFLVEEWGFSASDVRIILDRQATKQGMLDALGDWLPRVTRPGDRVVIYFSGHGSQVDDVSGDERDGKDETFVPTDWGRNGARAEDMLLDDELANALKRLDDRLVILIADSCHSGTVTKSLRVDALNAKARYIPFRTSTKGFVREEEPISEEVNVHLTLSAAMPDQYAWESDGAGVFTKLFIEALTDMRADANNTGVVTTAELMNYVKPRTEKWCDEVPDCRDERLGFTPNIDPKDETFVLLPLAGDGLQAITQDDAGAISDILPELGDDTIDIEIQPGNRVRIGDKVSIRLTSANDGYLTLLDRNSRNELTLLFPTQADFDKGISDRIWAHRPLTVPNELHGFTFSAQKPAGPGQAIAIVTKDRIDFDRVLDSYRDYAPIDDKLDVMKSITAHLYRVWTGDDENRGAQWAVGYADYEISAR